MLRRTPLRGASRRDRVGTLGLGVAALFAAASLGAAAADLTSAEETAHAATVRPAVNWAAPTHRARVSGRLGGRACEALTRRNARVKRVDFYADGRRLNTERAAPWNCTWNTRRVADGRHRLKAVARDARGRSTVAATEVIVKNSRAPSVSWSAPANAARVSGRVEGSACEALARDDVGVARVDFYVDGRLLNTEREAPYNCYWDTRTVPDGPHRLKAVARDTHGNVRAATVEVDVENARRDEPPSVAFSAPANGAKVSGQVGGSDCEATADDDIAVERVDFYVDGNPLNTERYAAWNCILDTTKLSDGRHDLKAVARDTGGNATSATIQVDVANASVDSTPPAGGSDPGTGSDTPLTFAEECDGTALDRGRWTTDWGASFSPDTHFLPEQIGLGGGICRMKAERKATPSGRPWAGGLMHTKNSFNQRYGKFEMRAKIPKGKGMWPAFWLLPQSGEWPPEIDVMEIWANPLGSTPTDAGETSTTLHWKNNSGEHKFEGRTHRVDDFSKEFHTFAVEWREDVIVMLVDGVERGRITGSHVPRVPAYLIANLAVGSDWGGHPDATTPSGSELEIDYIRVWE